MKSFKFSSILSSAKNRHFLHFSLLASPSGMLKLLTPAQQYIIAIIFYNKIEI